MDRLDERVLVEEGYPEALVLDDIRRLEEEEEEEVDSVDLTRTIGVQAVAAADGNEEVLLADAGTAAAVAAGTMGIQDSVVRMEPLSPFPWDPPR